MIKSNGLRFLILLVCLAWGMTGCQSNNELAEEPFATISFRDDSEYMQTFSQLGLGVLFDYNLKLAAADRTSVQLWVEVYKDGERVDPYPLAQLSLGAHPDQAVEAPAGMGMIKLDDDRQLIILYAHGVKARHVVEMPKVGTGIYTWGDALNGEVVSLERGEPKVLAVYREVESATHIRSYSDESDIQQMLQSDRTVFLVKIQVRELPHADQE